MEKKWQFGYYLNRLANSFERRIDNAIVDYGITGKQARLLGFIKKHSLNGGARQCDIEEAFDIRRSSVTSIVQNLEKSGFITRENDVNDSRMKLLYLTLKGNEVFLIVEKVIKKIENALEKFITEDDLKRFETIAESILGYFNEA